jgi:hypothetical protein
MKRLDTWKFVIQFFFSSIVVGLCVFKLAATDAKDNPNAALYWGGLTGILGYWLPSPTNKQDDEQQALGLTVANFPANNSRNGQVPNSGGQILAAQVTTGSDQ